MHLHGELAVLRCESCGLRRRDLAALEPERFVACPGCGFARLRPDVVWFGEVPHGLDEVGAALSACTHFLALGTSGVVQPAASFLELARAHGARTWVAALEEPANLASGDVFVGGRAAESLPPLLESLAARGA